MGLSIEEVRNNRLMSDWTLRIVPERCMCGSKIEISESLKRAYCLDENCTIKIANRMYRMLNKLSVTSWSIADCLKFTRQFELRTPFQVMLVNDVLMSSIKVDIEDFESKAQDAIALANKELYPWEIVELAGIKYVSSCAYEMFSEYKDFSEAYNDIEDKQVSIVCDKLGIEDDKAIPIALRIYNLLILHKDELLFAETQFKERQEENNVYISVSCRLQNHINSESFINWLNWRYGTTAETSTKHEHFKLSFGIRDNTSVLVTNGDASSSKYKVARKMNEEHVNKCISDKAFSLCDIGNEHEEPQVVKVGQKILICSEYELERRLDELMRLRKAHTNTNAEWRQ